ncbi:hypothetical protein ANN_26058 [Periplaneta americana]|uniref:Nuclease HARBI1 n=1 Tax=Periplaneta americana TaxID=6978 RepID=A0ABQ8S5N4_PERAM|nr:hypothetical protein ANN_26058 [Periplaneta americana]
MTGKLLNLVNCPKPLNEFGVTEILLNDGTLFGQIQKRNTDSVQTVCTRLRNIQKVRDQLADSDQVPTKRRRTDKKTIEVRNRQDAESSPYATEYRSSTHGNRTEPTAFSTYVNKHEAAVRLTRESVRRILHVDLKFQPYKLQIMQELKANDHRLRLQICRVYTTRPRTLHELKQIIRKEIRAIPAEMLQQVLGKLNSRLEGNLYRPQTATKIRYSHLTFPTLAFLRCVLEYSVQSVSLLALQLRTVPPKYTSHQLSLRTVPHPKYTSHQLSVNHDCQLYRPQTATKIRYSHLTFPTLAFLRCVLEYSVQSLRTVPHPKYASHQQSANHNYQLYRPQTATKISHSHLTFPTLAFLRCVLEYSVHSLVMADNAGVSKATVCRTISKVSAAIGALRPNYIINLQQEKIAEIKRGFYDLAHFPGIVGALDCTHSNTVSGTEPRQSPLASSGGTSGSMSVNVWCGIVNHQLIGPFFIEGTTDATYRKLMMKVTNSTRSGAGTIELYKPEWFAQDKTLHIVQRCVCTVRFLFPYLEGVNRRGGERDRAVQFGTSSSK